jgi:prepilin-type N-terminal cleavage/methylation domain-containing protein
MVARLRARLAQEDGMTLIELLTTMTIMGIVMSAIIGVFVSGLHAEVDMNKRFQAQQEVRLALTSMRTDIRTACSPPAVSVLVSGAPNSVPAGTPGDTVVLGFCGSGTTWSSTPVSYVTWCARSEGGTPAHYGLFRETANDPNCATGSAGIRKADSLTTAPVFTSIVQSGVRPELALRFPVDADLSHSGGLYTLSDTVMLRNAAVSP